MVQSDFLTEDCRPVTGTIWLFISALGDWLKEIVPRFQSIRRKMLSGYAFSAIKKREFFHR